MSAQRLPGKPLLNINNLPIISHVFKRGQETELGDVVVCAEDIEIVSAVEKNGGKAVLTGNYHKNGTERIYEGLQKLKMTNVDHIISLQGDEPEINPEDIKNLYNNMIKNNSDMGTLAAEIKEDSMLCNKNIVKVKMQKKKWIRVGGRFDGKKNVRCAMLCHGMDAGETTSPHSIAHRTDIRHFAFLQL